MAQTYGKKKTAGTSAIHRDLFGRDTEAIESQLSRLAVGGTRSPASAGPSPKKAARQFEIATDATASDVPDIPQLPQVLSKSSSTASQNPDVLHLPQSRSYRSPISQVDFLALEPLLSLSENGVDTFATFGDKLAKSFNIEKLGEGSFAEVFKITPKFDQPSTSSSISKAIPSGGTIMKLIPLQLPSSGSLRTTRATPVNGVAREVKISQTLDSVHGFIRFRSVRIVTGSWPKAFLDAWSTFRRRYRKRALNGSPKEDFDGRQAYAILEMNDAGHEISLIKRPSVFQVFDIFWQSVILLAIAEEQIEFEHRDLHLSNLCVKSIRASEVDESDSNNSSESASKLQRELDIDRNILKDMTDDNIPALRLGHARLEVTIIDYTVTRCLLAPSTSTAYDPMRFLSGDLFDGAEYEETAQMTTYRKTKAAVLLAQKTSGVSKEEKWSQHVPQTNVMWLGYLLNVLSHRAKERMNRYYVLRGSSRVAKELQEDMWNVLGEVQDFVDGVDPDAEEDSQDGRVSAGVNNLGNDKEFSDEELRRIPEGARALLARAVEQGWLNQGEIEAYRERLEVDG